MGILHQSGLRVPEDVALIGFDDIPLAQEMVPPLTTVRIPLDQIGRRAAQLVLESIDNPHEGSGRREMITPELVYRNTT
jgi:LacI family transcriptional regulator